MRALILGFSSKPHELFEKSSTKTFAENALRAFSKSIGNRSATKKIHFRAYIKFAIFSRRGRIGELFKTWLEAAQLPNRL